MNRPIILTDLDNTIYNWVDYFVPSFMAMVRTLAGKTGIKQKEIIEDFKRVYEVHGSVEYSFSVQELALCRNKSPEEVMNLVLSAKEAFSLKRREVLRPYDAVRETLLWALEKGVKIIGVTNCPLFHAQRRLEHLQLDELFYGLAAWEGEIVPETDSLTLAIKNKEKSKEYHSKIAKTWSLSAHELKPNPAAYLTIINCLDISPDLTYVIGDNLFKDISPALEIGAKGVWAKYGEKFEKKNFETLLKITPWDKEKVTEIYSCKKDVVPSFSIDTFFSLQKIIKFF